MHSPRYADCAAGYGPRRAAYRNQSDLIPPAAAILWCTAWWQASLHAAGALKHHWVDRDITLKRMLGR